MHSTVGGTFQMQFVSHSRQIRQDLHGAQNGQKRRLLRGHINAVTEWNNNGIELYLSGDFNRGVNLSFDAYFVGVHDLLMQ